MRQRFAAGIFMRFLSRCGNWSRRFNVDDCPAAKYKLSAHGRNHIRNVCDWNRFSHVATRAKSSIAVSGPAVDLLRPKRGLRMQCSVATVGTSCRSHNSLDIWYRREHHCPFSADPSFPLFKISISLGCIRFNYGSAFAQHADDGSVSDTILSVRTRQAYPIYV